VARRRLQTILIIDLLRSGQRISLQAICRMFDSSPSAILPMFSAHFERSVRTISLNTLRTWLATYSVKDRYANILHSRASAKVGKDINRPIIFVCHSLGGIIVKEVRNPQLRICPRVQLTKERLGTALIPGCKIPTQATETLSKHIWGYLSWHSSPRLSMGSMGQTCKQSS
jgi:hypothetical protein